MGRKDEHHKEAGDADEETMGKTLGMQSVYIFHWFSLICHSFSLIFMDFHLFFIGFHIF